jgi:STIP1 family protein 1
MAGQDLPHDPAKALEYKEKGNKCFQAGDYHGAEELYTKAFVSLSFHPLLSLPLNPKSHTIKTILLTQKKPTE